MKEELEKVIAQLRHLFKHLDNGTLGNPKDAAWGLLGPQIVKLEGILRALEGKQVTTIREVIYKL